ncbi:hypothetical protein SELMODRAFT_60139, partial [Selaginella moellendorffii]
SWNIIITACIQNNAVGESKGLFDRMPERDTITWNSLLSAYAQRGHLEEANDLFYMMPERDYMSWNTLIQASASSNLDLAQEIYHYMPEHSHVSWSVMLTAYANFGHLDKTRSLFDSMPERNLISWTAMAAGYAQNGYLQESYSEIFSTMPERDVFSWTAMITVYGEFDDPHKARRCFDLMPHKNVVSWSAMFQAAYAHNGHLESAKIAFERMPSRDVVSWNSIIAFFSQKGKLEEAKDLFHLMPEPNTAAWNVMIQAHAQSGHLDLAMDVFRLMDLHGVSPDSVTYIAIFDACSRIANAEEGSAFIASIVHPGILQDSVAVGNAALTMYGRSGLAAGAWSVFQQMPVRDSVSWNAMLTAFARNGHGEAALDVFLAMELEGLVPDIITFVNVLSACSHAGLLHRARGYFHSISCDYGLTPIYDHYVCLTDLLARSGRLVEAEELVNSMPFEPNYEAWMALLGACRSHGDVRRGNRAAGFFVQAGVDAESPYVLLSHLYAEAGSKDDVLVIRKAMRRK